MVQMNNVMMVEHWFEVRQQQVTDYISLPACGLFTQQTNLFPVSRNAAVAQGQACFGTLHGSSGHHTALRGLEMVVHGLATS